MKRTYGNEKTKLILSEKSKKVYNASDPLKIIEREEDIFDDSGEFVKTVFSYEIHGIIERENLSGEDVNQIMESFYDEIFSEEND